MKLKLVPESAKTPLEQAAHWAVAKDRDQLDAAEQAEFEAWVEEGENRLLLDRADDALSLFDGVDPDSPDLAALRAEAAMHGATPNRRWMPWAGGALAASIAAGFLFFAQTGLNDIPVKNAPAVVASTERPTSASAASRYSTAVGEQRVVKLADGSTVTLNTATEITVDYRPGERLVRLVRGQALFDVAHAKDRPFSVIVSGRKVTALGTLFEVRLDRDRLRVTLLRGRVRVDEDIPESAATKLPQPIFLSPGEQFSAAGQAVPFVQSIDPDHQLLWRQSLVEFNDEPLGDAVAELNRYSATPIVIADDRVAAMRISGIVKAGDTDAFSSLVGAMLPVAARKNAKGEVEIHPLP